MCMRGHVKRGVAFVHDQVKPPIPARAAAPFRKPTARSEELMTRNLLASVAALALVFSGSAHAQKGIGIAAGWSLPTSDFGDVVNSGYHVTGLFNVSSHDSRSEEH